MAPRIPPDDEWIGREFMAWVHKNREAKKKSFVVKDWVDERPKSKLILPGGSNA
jgi:hypothetical protein